MSMATAHQVSIEAAADDCRDNAVATLIDRHGQATVQGWDFNTYLDETSKEQMAQAGYFADERGVTREEVLAALHLI